MQHDPSVHARLDALERKNRRLQRLVALLALGLLGACAAGFTPPAEKELRAEKFVLTDAAGEERGTLALDPKGHPYLALRQGKANAILTLAGPGLSLRGEDGMRGAWIGVDPKGSSGLTLTSENVLDGIRLRVQPDGSAGAYLLGENGRERVTLESLADGTAGITSRSHAGQVRTFFGLSGNDLPSLLLIDGRNVKRAGLLLQPGGEPLLSLDDATGRSRVELTESMDGAPRLRMFGADGSTSFEAP